MALPDGERGGPIISSRCIIRSRLQSALDWSYLEIPFVISSRGATTMLGYVFVEPRARLSPDAFAALSAITRHQRIPPTYPVRVPRDYPI